MYQSQDIKEYMHLFVNITQVKSLSIITNYLNYITETTISQQKTPSQQSHLCDCREGDGDFVITDFSACS